jgi:hypothetical protein
MAYMALLRFLAHREMQEMLRKPLLSVVGALWTQKSVTCVATALVLSATSHQVLHTAYWPFKSRGCMAGLATIQFRFIGPSSFNTAIQLVLRPHFLVHFV